MYRVLLFLLITFLVACGAGSSDRNDVKEWLVTAKHGKVTREAFLKSWRFVHGWLQFADPVTGLLPRNLTYSPYWNAQDSAADNYPFMVITSFLTDRNLFNGKIKEILSTEQLLTNRVDRLPDDWFFETQSFRTPEPNLQNIIFGASEYAKDGLLSITEFLGPSVWSERMIEIVDDILKNAVVETEVGLLPDSSEEVLGNLLQLYSRVYWITGSERYRTQALLIGDYFLIHHPPAKGNYLKLDDHGCEVINGLSEAYLIAFKTDPDRHARWKIPMHELLDTIISSRDENGLLYNEINPTTGQKLSNELTDNWGYVYNSFLVVAELDREPKYRQAVEYVLDHIINAKDYKWEDGIADGYADALEGGLYLINRIPTPKAVEWADYVARLLLDKPQENGIIEGWHGDGNFARTALMYALWKTQGSWVEPWRSDLRIGATKTSDGYTAFEVQSDEEWEGTLHFDTPRHKEFMHLPLDYPRLNQFPEWFTVPNNASNYDMGNRNRITGQELRKGLKITVKPNKPFRIILKLT